MQVFVEREEFVLVQQRPALEPSEPPEVVDVLKVFVEREEFVLVQQKSVQVDKVVVVEMEETVAMVSLEQAD